MDTQKLLRNSDTYTAKGYHKTNPVLIPKIKVLTFKDFNTWNLDNLTDYIIVTHHSYVKKNVAVIYDLARELANQHGEEHPELFKLTEVTFLFFHDLLNHLANEEQILFPNIKQMAKKRKTTYKTFGLIRDTVTIMKKQHVATDKNLKLFQGLTHDYTFPADASNSYKYLLKKMKELENDLVVYINLESTILLPKAIALDKKIQKDEKDRSRWKIKVLENSLKPIIKLRKQ